MYCPKCAAQNGDDARFCRVCGSNLSLIPQALTGQLPAPQVVEYDSRGRRRAPSFERGISTIFMGIGFAIVALTLVMFTRNWWGVFMLIPAFSMLGSGVSMVLAHKNQLRAAQAPFAFWPWPWAPAKRIRAAAGAVSFPWVFFWSFSREARSYRLEICCQSRRAGGRRTRPFCTPR